MSGPRRWLLASVLALALLADGAAWSAAFSRGDFEASMLLLYPERAVGRELLLSLVDVRSIEPGGYVVGEGPWQGTVRGDPTGLQVGDELYLRGVFLEPSVIEERWRELAPQRGGKKRLGLLAMLLLAVVLGLGVRLTPDGAVLRG